MMDTRAAVYVLSHPLFLLLELKYKMMDRIMNGWLRRKTVSYFRREEMAQSHLVNSLISDMSHIDEDGESD